jgi:acetylornithine deacetylase/succinyl-diaminopimelate desuccinylase-like protein
MGDAGLEKFISEAQSLLVDFCRFPSIATQNGDMASTASWLERELTKTGFETQQINIEGAPPYIFAESKGLSPITLLLYNHYDVQPADPLELWLSPPFEPTIREDKLYARGVADNKGGICTRLGAFRALVNRYGELPITIKWIIEGEEEIGSPNFGALARQHADLLSADGGLWEESDFDENDRPSFTLGFKGMLYVQLEAKALHQDAHSGFATVLPSAAWRLLKALASIKDKQGVVRIPGFYDAIRQPTPDEIETMRKQPDLEDQYLDMFQISEFIDGVRGFDFRRQSAFKPTANIAGFLTGYTGQGVKTVLPAEAMAKMDFRLVPNQIPEDIFEKLQYHLSVNGFDDIKLTILGSASPVVTPIDTPLVGKIIHIAEEFAGLPASVTTISGGTLPFLEAMSKYVGVPGFSTPGNATYYGCGVHAPNEHIRLKDFDRGLRYNVFMFEELGKER